MTDPILYQAIGLGLFLFIGGFGVFAWIKGGIEITEYIKWKRMDMS